MSPGGKGADGSGGSRGRRIGIAVGAVGQYGPMVVGGAGAFALAPGGQRRGELRGGDPVPAVRDRGQETAGDLVFALGAGFEHLQAFAQDGSTATLRAIQEPLVPWIWAGGMIVVLGALVSLGGARRELATAPSRARVPVAGPRPAPVPAEEAMR